MDALTSRGQSILNPLPYSRAALAQFLNSLIGLIEQLHQQIFATFRPVAFGAFFDQFTFEGLNAGLQRQQHIVSRWNNGADVFSRWMVGGCASLPCFKRSVYILIHLASAAHFNHQSEYAQIVICEASGPALLRLGSWGKELTELLTPALNRLMAAIKKGLNIRCCVHTLMLAHVRTRALMSFIQGVRLLHSGCAMIASDVLLSTMHYSAGSTKRTEGY